MSEPSAQRVLIVDDDPDFNAMLTDVLESSGYEVTSERRPQIALAAFELAPFDVVITDHKMPDIGGEAFMKACLQRKPDTHVIMISGYLTDEQIQTMLHQGATRVFLKPFMIGTLIEALQSLEPAGA